MDSGIIRIMNDVLRNGKHCQLSKDPLRNASGGRIGGDTRNWSTRLRLSTDCRVPSAVVHVSV